MGAALIHNEEWAINSTKTYLLDDFWCMIAENTLANVKCHCFAAV